MNLEHFEHTLWILSILYLNLLLEDIYFVKINKNADVGSFVVKSAFNVGLGML